MKQAWVTVSPWNKELVVAAIESGADAVLVAKGDTPRVKELGRITTVAEDGDIVLGKDVIRLDIQSKADEQRAAAVPHDITLLLRMQDWTIIPLENLLAQRERLMAEARTLEEARTMLGVLEKGVDGILINSLDPQSVR